MRQLNTTNEQSGQARFKLSYPSIFQELDSFARQMHRAQFPMNEQSGQARFKLLSPSIFQGLDSFARQMHFPLASVRILPGGLFIS
jgi:hypothetical protein